MVPPSSLRIPRVRRYSGYCRFLRRFAYEAFTLSCRASHPVRLQLRITYAVHTPSLFPGAVWPLPLSLATTHRISFDFSSSGYLDVSVPRVPRRTLWIHARLHDSSSWGFPHSEIRGSRLICSSPRLIAACHVLLRLLMPRHSLCALVRLNFCRISLEYSLFSRLNCCVSRFTVTFVRLAKLCFFTQLWKDLIL